MAGDVRRQVERTRHESKVDDAAERAVPNPEHSAGKARNAAAICQRHDAIVMLHQVAQELSRVLPDGGELFSTDISGRIGRPACL